MQIDYKVGAYYTQLGTSELSSVPYALYSEKSSDWTRDGDNLFANNPGFVGIGTQTQNGKLAVYDNSSIGIYGESFGSYGVCGKTSACSGSGILGEGLTSNSWGVYGYNAFGGVAVRGYSAGGFAGFFIGDCYVSEKAAIGTQSPSYPVHVKKSHSDWLVGIHNESSSASAHGLVVRAEGGDPFLAQNSISNLFIIKNNGKVGIGTNSPDAILHVNDHIRVGEDPSYSTVYGELIHEGGGNGFVINANAGGGSWADMLFQTNGNTRMFIENAGRIGIGTTSPLRKVHIYATETEDALYAFSQHGTGVWASSIDDYGLFAQSSVYIAGYFSGDVYVTGTLGKGAGSFVIDHPLDPENKLLRHNFVESPENLLIYRGKIQLDRDGRAQVKLPDYFVALTKENEATVALTCIDVPFLTAYKWQNDGFLITGEPGRFVSWVVYADRDDPVIHELGRPVEEEKGEENAFCDKGKLLYPQAYGYPESAGRDYEYFNVDKIPDKAR